MSPGAPRKPPATRRIRWPWSYLPKQRADSFAWNSMFTSARSVVTILAQIVFTPIIVKLYSPEDYGTFGFIFSMSTIAATVFSLQYDKALFLPSNEKDIQGLKAVCISLPFYFSLLLTVILLFFHGPLLRLAGVEGIGKGIFLVPLLTILGAWSTIGQRLVSVRYRYKEGFLYGSVVTVGAKLVAILHGIVVGGHYFGLVLSEIFNRVVLQLLSTRVILKEDRTLRPEYLRLDRFWWVLRKYKNFPRYELPAQTLQILSTQIPVYWIPGTYGLAQLGQYALALALLEVPMRLFSYSLAGTFYQKAARTYEQEGMNGLRRISFRMMAWLSGVAVIPMLVVFLFAERLFVLVFGEEWALSGAISAQFAIFYFVRLIAETTMSTLRVMRDQRAYFRFHALLLVMRMATVYMAIQAGMELIPAISAYAIVSSIGYGFMILYITVKLRGGGAPYSEAEGPNAS